MNKRIYITGAISNLPYAEVQIKFRNAEEQIKKMGNIPVNPLHNGLDVTAKWSAHMVKDIEILFACDGVYVLTDSDKSVGSRIEVNIAKELELTITHQLPF